MLLQCWQRRPLTWRILMWLPLLLLTTPLALTLPLLLLTTPLALTLQLRRQRPWQQRQVQRRLLLAPSALLLPTH